MINSYLKVTTNWTKSKRRPCFFGQFAPRCENMTSFAKPEVHDLLHCRPRRTEPRPQVTFAENLAKFGSGWFVR